MPARWSKAEDATLIRRYGDEVAVRLIAAELERSEDAVNARRRLLGVPARRNPRWSVREDALLRAATKARVPVRIVARGLRRSVEQVRWRRRALGLAAPAPRAYRRDEQRALRAALAAGGGLDDLARGLSRTPDALRLQARKLRLYDPAPRPRWSREEDAQLRDGYERGLACRDVARELPRRSPGSVAARARKLGLATHARKWTDADDARLRQLARTRALEDAARVLGRTPDALRQRARKLGIAPPAASSPIRSDARWSAGEDELLAAHAALNPAVLAQLLGRSDRAVTGRLARLGLRGGRERSPHHPVPRNGRLTPGEQALVERELDMRDPRRVLLLAERLQLSPASLRAMAGLKGGRSPTGRHRSRMT